MGAISSGGDFGLSWETLWPPRLLRGSSGLAEEIFDCLWDTFPANQNVEHSSPETFQLKLA
jgi:hypothetical protein